MDAAIPRGSTLPADLDGERIEIVGKVDAAFIPVRDRVLFPAEAVVEGQLAADLPLIASIKTVFPLPHLQVGLVHLDPLVGAIEPAEEEVGEGVVLICARSTVQDRGRTVEDEPVLADFDVIRNLVKRVKPGANGV